MHSRAFHKVKNSRGGRFSCINIHIYIYVNVNVYIYISAGIAGVSSEGGAWWWIACPSLCFCFGKSKLELIVSMGRAFASLKTTKGTCIYEGNLYLWRELVFMKGTCIYERQLVFMKGNLYLWKATCIYEGNLYLWRELVFIKGNLYLWRELVFMKGTCIYEGQLVFMKGTCIYEGNLYLWRAHTIHMYTYIMHLCITIICHISQVIWRALKI